MQRRQPSLPFRNDTILGVCEAIGQDFGFHANYLRLLFAGLFYFNPLAVSAVYGGLGVLVFVSRWAFPNRADETTATVEARQSETLALAA